MKTDRRTFLKSLIGFLSTPIWYPYRARAGTLVSHPIVQNVGTDCATIVWGTGEGGSSAVRFTRDRGLTRSAAAVARGFPPADTDLPAPYYQHKVALTGLDPNTDYSYAVFADGQGLAEGDGLNFRTSGAGRLSFLAFGDCGSGGAEQKALAERMQQERPSLVLPLGDLAYGRGSFEEFQSRYFGVYREIMKRVPFFPCLGNHEYMTRNGFPYLALHDVPIPSDLPDTDRGRYYSFDWGNVHFVALDSNDPLERAVQGSGPMLEWLENDLRSTRKFWKIAYFHHPPYAGGAHDDDPLSALVRSHVVPILERYDVALVLSGHEHSYQRSYPIRNGAIVRDGEGTVYVTSGGGGAGLYPVSPNSRVMFGRSVHHYLQAEVDGSRLALRVMDISGNEIDRLVLAPSPRVSEAGVVNSASGAPPLAPGTLISIFGRNLATEDQQAAGTPLPRELSGVSVTANGELLPLLFVSPTQINAQLPFVLRDGAALRVRTANGVFDTPVIVSESAPGIFAVAHQNGELVSGASPSRPGEYLTAYGTGLGAVTGPIAAGEPAPFAPLLTARLPVEVEWGTARLRPSFAGLTPGRVGLYQVNFQVPAQLPSGQQPLRLRVGDSTSQPVPVPVALD
ncbi:MAG: hypothetical protein A3H28_02515 [Acidobacteria bacterium RIFCSPLOWO2_02_FULL_61_28]|nr:MAG: hypothetical protein A3H28_02515 [Acidobacteria bacterium RIFCSPLOWO2_02_FULL_61_28]